MRGHSQTHTSSGLLLWRVAVIDAEAIFHPTGETACSETAAHQQSIRQITPRATLFGHLSVIWKYKRKYSREHGGHAAKKTDIFETVERATTYKRALHLGPD